MKFFNFLLSFIFLMILIINCKNKEQEPLPTIDETNYDDKNIQNENEDERGTLIPEQSETAQSEDTKPDSLEKKPEIDISYHDEYKGKSMIGHFIYFADAAVFTPCGKTKPIPVQMGTQEYLKLEKSYSNTVEGGTPCFVEFLGKIEKLPSYDGGKKVDMVVVEKLIEVQFYRECP